MNKNQKQTLAATLVMAVLMVGQTSAGLVEKLTTWVWNYFVYLNAFQASGGCWYIGVWGLFFDNDDGLMIQTCMDMYGGANVMFPVEYAMN